MSDDYTHPLVDYLLKNKDDRGFLASLRRGLGRSVGENAALYQYVGAFVHEDWQAGDVFLLATLFALHPAHTGKGNMGDHLLAYTRAVSDDAATTRRFTQLLNLRRDSLDTPLRQHISLLKSQEIAVNWHRLMRDLQQWGHPARYIQKQWARAYWPPKSGKKQS